MKLVCDCGNEMKFEETGNKDECGYSENVSFSSKKFGIIGEHDLVWLTCKSCGKSITMAT